jgi:uncharacterized protein YdbL (DUF1318 family)
MQLFSSSNLLTFHLLPYTAGTGDEELSGYLSALQVKKCTHVANFDHCSYQGAITVCLPAGTGDEELSGYLSALQAEADALQLSGKGAAAEAAMAPLAAAADALAESGAD